MVLTLLLPARRRVSEVYRVSGKAASVRDLLPGSLMSSTLAVTPKLPFVPTWCATRVTSDANAANVASLSTISLMVTTSWRTSPCSPMVTFWLRSARATAVVALAMLRTWSVRLPHMTLTVSPVQRSVISEKFQTCWEAQP